MTNVDIYLYAVITLLGVAYPILLQVIARLDEKYESDRIVNLFNSEFENKAFRYTLISSLIFIFIWTLKLQPIFEIKKIKFVIDNSAAILVEMSSILLIIIFFLLVRKIFIYYTPAKFIPYLIHKHRKVEEELKYFNALSDILIYAIKNQNTSIDKLLSNFFYGAFKQIRNKYNHIEPVVYPESYYEIVYRSIEELAIIKEKRNYMLEDRTSGSIWLLGEYEEKKISENTYTWIWNNLLLAVRYNQDDLVFYHWKTANNYFTYCLPLIYKEFTLDSGMLKIGNETEVINRNRERQFFLEYHYMLGSLLLYKRRYSCLKRFFEFTMSQPPKYELLPESIQTIFEFYFEIADTLERKYLWISSKFPFQDFDGAISDYRIRKWASSYMALLFLRQYTINPYLSTMRPLGFPSIPKKQRQIKDWIDNLDNFKNLIGDQLNNKQLLKVLDFHYLTEDWCEKNEKLYPIEYIEEYKLKLEKKYKENAINSRISDEKKNEFNISTREIIEKTISKLREVFTNEIISDEVDNWIISGNKSVHSKDAFSEDPEIDHLNFNSVFGSLISTKIKSGLAETFFRKIKKTYALKSDSIFKAIDRMGIDENYLIINFGLDLNYFIKELKIPHLSRDEYKKITIIELDGNNLVHDSLFVIKKIDLPLISILDVPVEKQKKYGLDKISSNINLYSAIVDLNETTKDILDELIYDKDEAIGKSALIYIEIIVELKWKKKIDLVQVKRYYEYNNQDKISKLSDIKLIDDI